jgi:hypothetical protein
MVSKLNLLLQTRTQQAYQRAMYYIFHELIGKIVEIYIDDVVITRTPSWYVWCHGGTNIGRP